MTEYPSSVRPHEALGNTAKEGNKRVQFFPLTGDAGSNMCFEVLQWEPSKMTGDTDKFVPFQPKDGRWICGRKVTINYQQLRFEINDDASFWRAPGGAEASGSLYHWDQGPGGVGGGSLPFKKTHKKEATRVAQRWKVPFSDVDGYEQFCFSVPVLLAFDASGSLTFTEKDSTGEGARNLLAQSTPSASTNPARWAFRLWGPVGLVISLAGGVSLFLVFKSSEETAEFEAVLSPRVSVPPPVLRADPPPPPVARANPAAPPQVANVTWTVQTDAPRLPEPAVENDEEEGHVTHQKGEAETPRKHNVPHKREWALHLKPHDQPKSFERYYFYLPKHRNPHTDNEVNTVLYDSCKPKKSRSLTGRRKRASKRQDRERGRLPVGVAHSL
ncbi:hypothetical protein ADEAN_000557700 [Angomonas deanei]|uniref:Uncharacterized protein n=1 Tax=Angomonas deanei TaxID=59799 RepID=A0A7G2CGJ4_9TRYP|nr:hypothetical protein ADEAN_000557700 [Angomonas deanei]